MIPPSDTFDILAYWKGCESRCPVLSRIARDIYAIPVSTAASESAFSTWGRFVSLHHNRLHHKTLEALMCAKDWLWSSMESDGIPFFFSYPYYILIFIFHQLWSFVDCLFIFFVRWGRSFILSLYFFWWWCPCWEWWWSYCLEYLGKLLRVKLIFPHVYLLLELLMLRSSPKKKEENWKHVLFDPWKFYFNGSSL